MAKDVGSSKKSFKKRPLGKWTLRLIAFFVASTLWFYVVNSEPIEVHKRVELHFITPENKTISNIIDWQVELTLKGARAFMYNVFESGERVEVNLTTYDYSSGGPISVRLTPGDIPVPFGVEVVDISPSQFQVELERELTKSVRVSPQFIGSLPDGLRFVRRELTPNEVSVTGPQSMIRGLEQIRTEPIDLSGLRNSGNVAVRPASPDRRIFIRPTTEHGSDELQLGVETPTLSFSFEVRPEHANITLTNIPVHFLASTKSFRADSRHVSIDVMASESEQRRLRQSDVRVIGEVPVGAEGRVDVPLRAELPEGVFLLKIHPEKIQVTIESD